MSEVYALEPATKGKVILQTTLGPLEIELWSKEAPKACRNFIQLCMEGYYKGSLFHRVIPGFLVQTGDPTGTGAGGESVYGPAGFENELHSRLKFRYRGIVATATSSDSKKNGSQFFVTLDRAEGLNGKSTIFGRVTGPTIWNLVKFGELQIGEDDRPLEPVRITGAEIPWNPFPDIVPRVSPKPPEKAVEAAPERAAAKPSMATTRPLLQEKRSALVSFGADDGLDDEPDVGTSAAIDAGKRFGSIQAVHDVVGFVEEHPTDDASAAVTESPAAKLAALRGRIAQKQSKKDAAMKTLEETMGPREETTETVSEHPGQKRRVSDLIRESDEGVTELQREAVFKPPHETSERPDVIAGATEVTLPAAYSRIGGAEEAYSGDEFDGRGTTQLQMKKRGRVGHEARLAMDIMAMEDADLMQERERQLKYAKLKTKTTGSRRRQADAMERLKSFSQRLKSAASEEKEQEQPGSREDEDASDWLRTSGLKFAVDSTTAYAYDAARNALTTYDPRAAPPISEPPPQSGHRGASRRSKPNESDRRGGRAR